MSKGIKRRKCRICSTRIPKYKRKCPVCQVTWKKDLV